jgi:hypothetical protein
LQAFHGETLGDLGGGKSRGESQSYNDWQTRGKRPVGRQMSPRNQAHRPGTGIVYEKSFLSYYKNEFLRPIGVDNKTGNGMREQAHRSERAAAGAGGAR